jgi:hypothetical protein
MTFVPRIGRKVQLTPRSYTYNRHPLYSQTVGEIVKLTKDKSNAAVRFTDGFMLPDIAVSDLQEVQALTSHELGRR